MTGSREDLPGSFILRLNLQPYAARGSDKSTRAGSSHTREVRAGAASGEVGRRGRRGQLLPRLLLFLHPPPRGGWLLLLPPFLPPLPADTHPEAGAGQAGGGAGHVQGNRVLEPSVIRLLLPLVQRTPSGGWKSSSRALPRTPAPPAALHARHQKQNKCIPPKPVSSVVS